MPDGFGVAPVTLELAPGPRVDKGQVASERQNEKSFMEISTVCLRLREARGRQGAYSLIETASGRSAMFVIRLSAQPIDATQR
jgi:hypothetical protein